MRADTILPSASHDPDATRRFDLAVRAATATDLHAADLDTIQVNIGLTCNLACHHCHVESSPARKEQMTRATMQQVLHAAKASHSKTLDITGGAPEMNPDFRWFVDEARRQGLGVIVRTNLTILLAEGFTDLPQWLASRRVHLIASMPCYLETNVDKQRGKHVYAESIEAIRRLNAAGYAADPALPLDLVYNPGGASLPPDQAKLEADYRRELHLRFAIQFNRLYCITNMAIGRFLHDLRRDGRDHAYQQLLRESFNPATVEGLMCRHQIHVSWDGSMHDCDFNYALGMRCGPIGHIADFDAEKLRSRRIVTAEHCFGCTAGCGSSCGGALV